jgi:hypothetical protein
MVHFRKLIHKNHFGRVSMFTTQSLLHPTMYSVHGFRSLPSRTTVREDRLDISLGSQRLSQEKRRPKS